MLRPRIPAFAALVVAAALAAADARAAVIPVAQGESVAEALSRAAPGDTLHLAKGLFKGGLVIDRPGVTIEGEPGAILDGAQVGNVVTINAPDTILRGLTIQRSGQTLIDKNSGVFVDRTGDRAHIEGNRFSDNLIAIYLDGPHDAMVRRNEIAGLRQLRRTERGPAISLWNTPGSAIIDNDIRSGRDGVFSVSSSHNIVRGNTFHDLRFAVHFMYTNDSEVVGNFSAGNEVGYVLMFSDRLEVRENVSDRDRDHGLLFNYANLSGVEDNVARGSDKCVFIYNANKNRFTGNWFEGCNIGIHFTAGSERNEISGNAFVNNRTQVMYVGTRLLDWSVRGRGNYYSDNPAFDLNGDGIADTAYRPNNLMDQVIWRAPAAKLLLNSPAVQIVRWAQARFPAIHPGGVIDSAPLMTPVQPSSLERLTP
ncbi:nitrous oxide reductase family maturation protein NosD [Rhodoblastus sp. 17X3]|uniref:nitrous oxide reductase family maturation protein NosD n=1 Tax=Rhodoblastus sp. 17X3 TaxID=3047026 RepID=UPI0024B84382|nr:nitrous oxide reductase family maturation protein NosD [Rhodoblastus sp. 17X3]MDI9847408.1 nitrous oxide reductase family maturation protein NosD [Rhodoblastus sp. 17X3]